MQIIKIFILLLSFLTLLSCGSTASLNKYGRQVSIVKIEPLQCEEIGRFYGRGTATKYAINNLLNIVGENNGTHVYISNVSDVDGVGSTFVVGNDHTAHGFAFNCKVLVN